MSHPSPATLHRIGAVAGGGTAAILLVNAAKRADVIPTTAVTQLVAPLAQILALALITVLYLAYGRRAGTFGLVGYLLNAFSLAALVGVEFVINLVFAELPDDTTDALRAGPLGVALTVASVAFLLGTAMFVAAMVRTGEVPTTHSPSTPSAPYPCRCEPSCPRQRSTPGSSSWLSASGGPRSGCSPVRTTRAAAVRLPTRGAPGRATRTTAQRQRTTVASHPRGAPRQLTREGPVTPLYVLLGVTATTLVLHALAGGTPARHWPNALRYGLAAMFVLTGISHFVGLRDDLIAIVPPALPAPWLLVAVTGVLSLAGAAGLLWRRSATLSAAGLTALLVAIFPANVYATVADLQFDGEPAAELPLRAGLQVIYIAAALAVALTHRHVAGAMHRAGSRASCRSSFRCR